MGEMHEGRSGADRGADRDHSPMSRRLLSKLEVIRRVGASGQMSQPVDISSRSTLQKGSCCLSGGGRAAAAPSERGMLAGLSPSSQARLDRSELPVGLCSGEEQEEPQSNVTLPLSQAQGLFRELFGT